MAETDLGIDATLTELRRLGASDVALTMEATRRDKTRGDACVTLTIDAQRWQACGQTASVALRRALRLARRLGPTTVANTRVASREYVCGVSDGDVGCGATIAAGDRYLRRTWPPDELLPYWREAKVCLRCAGDDPVERRRGVHRLREVKQL